MKKRARGLLSIALCACLLLNLTACSGSTAGQAFRYDIPDPVDNLDPQFATDSTARMILSHIYEGLVLLGSDGEIQPGAAESYTVSADRTAYTFNLREDAVWPETGDKDWPGGEAVSSQDFVFAFRRIFRDGSPHAWKYSAIAGADNMSAGASGTLSGISAPDERTLVFTLSEPDPHFLERLADPAAFPCSPALYERARGRYGLEPDYVYGNGPFEISRWDNVRLSLEASESYRSESAPVAGAVHFYIGRDAAAQFLDGKTDVAMLNGEQAEAYGDSRGEVIPIQKTVWCVVFNQNHPLWGNALLRQALVQAVNRDEIAGVLPAGRESSPLFVPGAMRVMGRPFRELATGSAPYDFDPDQAHRLFSLGLDALGLSRLPSTAAILIPEEIKDTDAVSSLQQGWQKHLSAYISFDVNSVSDIQARFRSGDYQMLIMPMTPATDDIATLMEAFSSGSAQNHVGYASPLYDELLADAAVQSTPELAASKYARAETLLLADAVLIPLCFETSYLAVAEGVSGLEISAFGDDINFKYASKE